MGQDCADINFLSVVVDGGNEANFVAANVKDGELADLIGIREKLAQLDK